MNNNIKIKINLDKCTEDILKCAIASLEEGIGVLQEQTIRNTAVDTGETKGSWETKVDEKNLISYIGSNYQNAIWEEFGTGIYALNGDGRKDVPWVYSPDGGETFYKTKGKKPRRALARAFASKRKLVKQIFEERFGQLK